MSRKSKGVVLDSNTTPFGIGVCDDTKARLKYQSLMQDFVELQKEVDFKRSKLEASKQRKLMLAAEVRFLRKRYKYLVNTKNTSSFQEQNLVPTPNLVKRPKILREQLFIGKEASQHNRLPSVPEQISKKKQVLRETFPVSDQPRKKKTYSRKEANGHGSSLIHPWVSDTNHKGIMHTSKAFLPPNMTRILDRTPKERMFGTNDATLRNLAVAFDLNQDSTPSEKEASLPTRTPIFDLNEISTGEDDFQVNVEANKLEEARKSLIRGLNEEQQNDLKLSICRNAGETSSRAGKRKISWQDPVALRV